MILKHHSKTQLHTKITDCMQSPCTSYERNHLYQAPKLLYHARHPSNKLIVSSSDTPLQPNKIRIQANNPLPEATIYTHNQATFMKKSWEIQLYIYFLYTAKWIKLNEDSHK